MERRGWRFGAHGSLAEKRPKASRWTGECPPLLLERVQGDKRANVRFFRHSDFRGG